MRDGKYKWIDRHEIRSVILGRYAFGKGIEIYHASEAAQNDADMTTGHEAFHFYVCASTPYGLFQCALGRIISLDSLPKSLRHDAKVALDNSISHSWMAHEGTATFHELLLTAFVRGADRFAESVRNLPPEYKSAVDPMVRVLLSLDVPLLAVSPICDALAFLAFSTSVLDDMSDLTRIQNTDWMSYFSTREKSPDNRLRQVLEMMGHEEVIDAISRLTMNATTRILNCDVDEFPRVFVTLPLSQQRVINDMVFHGLIAHMTPFCQFAVQEPTAVHAQHRRLTTQWNVTLRQHGDELPLPELVTERGIPAVMLHLLDNTEFTAADKHFDGKLFFIPTDSVSQLIPDAEGNPIYFAKLLYNNTDDFIGSADSPLRIPPGGSTVLMHAACLAKGAWSFQCPARTDSHETSELPAAFMLPADTLSEFVTHLCKRAHVLCIDEAAHVAFRRHYGHLISSAECCALIVVACMSAPSHWIEAILHEQLGRDAWVVHSHDIPGWGNNYGFLVAGAPGCSSLYIRPAPAVSSWLLRSTHPTHYRVPQLSRELLTHLQIACSHYWKHGW